MNALALAPLRPLGIPSAHTLRPLARCGAAPDGVLRIVCSSHLSFRPRPVVHLGDDTVGSEFAPDKHVIKDSVDPNDDPLDSYFGF